MSDARGRDAARTAVLHGGAASLLYGAGFLPKDELFKMTASLFAQLSILDAQRLFRSILDTEAVLSTPQLEPIGIQQTTQGSQITYRTPGGGVLIVNDVVA